MFAPINLRVKGRASVLRLYETAGREVAAPMVEAGSGKPQVSIGLPVFNGERFLGETLDSIMAQTFRNFEVVIADNASTDQTEKICREYASKDPRIKYFRHDVNYGAASNFNFAFGKSSGSYFRWSSANDVFAPGSLEACVGVLDAHPEVVLCYPKTVLIDEQGNVIGSYEDKLDLRVPSPADRFRTALRNIRLVNVHYGLIRSDVLRLTALLRPYLGADIVLLSELALHGQFWEIPERLFFRRMHPSPSRADRNRSLETAQEFWDPDTRGAADLYYWRRFYNNVLSIFRAPIGPSERFHIARAVVRHAFDKRDVHLHELVMAGRHLLGSRKRHLS
jgi:glycosyltransferase involved in cell wall biosynthesis